MLMNQLAQRYSQAIYEIASEKNMMDQVEAQLNLVQSAIAGYSDLSTLMYHPQVPAQAKKETVNKIFANELDDFVRNFLFLLIDKRREAALPAIVREYVKLANAARNILEAEVITAKALNPEQQRTLADKISKVTCKKVVLKSHVNEEILGGVIVKIGDKLIDGSVVRQLKSLQAALLAQ
ncbi:MAG TPA: ATP synthase F1 subunit delta [Methylomusa anaerophila]|uniref:ATP synthase subunit delta n=1 Tax=Methylomusa anaerophila TaxID=1930071 RepID=A0A348AKC9_9FIRM|nr:ATP synthase F1 subunit delta [Methylomusa anaerophila]BBB91527.1 ATP synthase subunit delta [Methylomusa anaerophila]HML89535.1 ATP synthase F1 subunit delta [Methylomusa anaerophila]